MNKRISYLLVGLLIAGGLIGNIFAEKPGVITKSLRDFILAAVTNNSAAYCEDALLYEYTVGEYNGGEVTITKYNGDAAMVRIPNEISGMSVTLIGDGAFAGNESLVSVILPERLERIGAGAFENCINLKDLKMFDYVKMIDGRAFYNCKSLVDFKTSDLLKLIADEAFAGCVSLTNLSFTYLEEMGDRVFADCASLLNIEFPVSFEYIGEDVFDGADDIVITGDYAAFVHDYAAHNDIPFIDIDNGKIVTDYVPDPEFNLPEAEMVELFNIPVAGTNMKRIALSAGHHYNTEERRTPRGDREWAMNSAMANWVEYHLRDYNVEIARADNLFGEMDNLNGSTASGDSNGTIVRIARRTAFVNAFNPDFYLCIHTNAGSGVGPETYVRTDKYEDSTLRWGGKKPMDIAHEITIALEEAMELKLGEGRRNKHAASGEINVAAHIPAVLVEVGFFDGDTDDPIIASTVGQDVAGKALADYLIKFLSLEKRVVE